MKQIIIALVVSLALVGCSAKDTTPQWARDLLAHPTEGGPGGEGTGGGTGEGPSR